MDGFKLNDVSDVYVGGTLAKQVYAGDTKIWDYKTPPAYTAPTAKAGLVYSGSAQALLNAGSTSHGTIQYSADGLSWSTSIPTSTNASASITVYWRLVGDGRHIDIASTAVVCSIAKAAPTYTAPTAKSGLVYNNTNQALLNAGSTSHGTVQYSSNGSTWGADIPIGKNATGYTVYWRLVGDSNHNSVSSTSIACSISKVTPTVTAPTAKTLTYSGSAQALVNAGSTNWGTLQYSLDNSTWSTSIPTGTNATSYTVYYKVVGNSNINDVAAKSVSCSIGKVTPTVTAPTAKVLTYNTSAQELVNAGSTNFGTLQYSLNNSTWGTTIPSATNQGSYTVYYRVVGNSNINDVASASVACSINEKKVTATVTLSQSTYTYSGSACKPAVTVKDGSTVIPASEYTVSYSNNINAGTATVTISDNTGGNYEVIGSTTFTINKASGVAGVSGRSLTYSRGAQNLATVSGNTGTVHFRLGTSGSFSTTIPTATNAGSYTVQYYVDASANYNGVASSSSPNSVSTVIAQVTPVLSISPSLVTGLTYNGRARNLLSGGAMKHSSSDTTAVNGTFSYTQQTNAGTYNNPTWSFTPSDTTNYKSTSGTITGSVTIAKAAGSVNISAISVSYNGSARNLVSVSGNTGTMHYRVGTSGSFSGTIPTATNAASYDIYWYMDASTNYNGLHSSSSPAKVTSSIAKIDPTITAPTAKTGLVYNGSEQTLWNAGTNTTAGSFSYSKGTKAGSYTATWSFTPTDTTNYNTKSGSATISIAKAAGSISYATTSVSKTYGNGAFTNTLTKSGDGSVTYASNATGVATVNSSGQVTIVGAGSATITATVTDGTNYTYATKTASYTLSVAKATPTVTAPTAKSLTYSGSAQTLINAGSTTGGTIQYKLGSGSYGTGLPSATAKGTYTVYYKVVGNSNYNNVAEASISVSIAAKALTITAKDQSVSYGTAISTGTSQVTVSGLVSGDSLTAITLTQSTTNVTTSGTITPSSAATTKGAGNYSITYNTGKLTITAVAPVKTDPAKATGLTFNGSAQNLVTAGSSSHGTFSYKLSTASSYGSSVPTGINAGTYAVDWKFVADANHGGSTTTGSITGISIAVKSLTITAKAQTVNYGTAITQGTGQVTTSGLVSGDSLTAITLTQSTTNVTTTGTITPSGATTTKGVNNYSVTYNKGTLTINKVSASVSTAPSAKSLTYSGSAQALVNAGTPSGGTMYYQMTTSNSKPSSTSGFSTTIPTGTNAGTYYVWYYVKGDSNHNDSAISSSAVSVTIANKSISIPTPTGVSRAYNGNAATATFGAATGASITKYRYGTNGTSWTETTTNPSQTNVGTLYVQAYYKAGTNYTGSGWSASATLTISQVTPTVTAPTAKVLTYNTSAQALVNAGSTNFGTLKYSLDNSTWSTSVPTATNQGSYTVYYKVDGNSNIKSVDAKSVACSINTKEVTATVTLSQTSYTYSGSACKPTVTVKDGSTVIPASEYTVTYSNNTNVGTATVTITDNTGGNYDVVGSATFTISKANISPSVSLNGWTYGGKANNPSVSGNPGSGSVTYHYKVQGAADSTYTTTKPSSAGSYTVRATIAATSNYNGNTCTTNFTIAQKEVTLTWGTVTWTYNKSAHSTTCTAGSLVSGDTCTVTLTGNSITNVGTTTVTASSLSNSNYKLPSAKTKTLTVNARTVTLSWGTLSWTYDKTAHSTTCTAGNLCSGDTCTVTLTGNSITNKGTATVTASSLSNSNYALPSAKTATLTVNAREVTLSWGTTSWTYDGSAHSTTCTAGNLCSGDTCTVTLTGNSITHKGSTTVTASSLSNGNYKLPSANTKSISISAKSITLTWGTVTWTYDKTAHSTTCTATSLVGSDTCTVTLSGNSITNKGTTTVTASLGNSDYSASNPTATLTINARTVTLSWGTLSWTYDGSAHSTTCTAGNVCSGDTCTVTLTGNSITNKGTATVTASSLSNSNYALPSTKTATLTINAKEVGLSWGTTSWTYDKASHSTTCTATGLISGDSCTVTLTGNSVGANVGSATVTASSLSNSNYKLPSAKTKTISITAKTVSLTWGTLSWTYDASAHSTTCSAGSLISGDSCSVTLTGNSITNKGTTTVTASSLSNSNYKLPSSKTNTLTINARPINVTAASASKTYDGSALTSNSATAEATGTNRGLVSGHSMTSCTVTGTITNAGTANNVPSAAVIKSGSTDVTSNYSITYVNGTLTVNQATGSATVSGRTVTYSRGAQNMVSVSNNTGTMHYRVGTSGSWTTTIPTRTTAGSDTIYYYMDASTNYTARGSSSSPWSSVTGKVEKCTPVLSTSPTYRTGLSYTGSAQNLLTGGAMKHSSSDSTTVEGKFTYDQGTNAGKYSSKKWYFTPDDKTNYSNTDGTVSGSTKIAKINRSSFAVSMSGWTYGGTVTNPSVSGNTENGSVTYEYKISGGSYSSTKPTSTSTAGTYYVKATAAATTNYYASTAESTFVIARASRTISFTSAPSTVIKGNTISVAASPSAGSGDGSISFSSGDTTKATISGSTITGVAKGTVNIYATISQGTNYDSASASYPLTVVEWDNAQIWSNTLTWPA
jgi:methionine-rich copper-binding protein CopC